MTPEQIAKKYGEKIDLERGSMVYVDRSAELLAEIKEVAWITFCNALLIEADHIIISDTELHPSAVEAWRPMFENIWNNLNKEK